MGEMQPGDQQGQMGEQGGQLGQMAEDQEALRRRSAS